MWREVTSYIISKIEGLLIPVFPWVLSPFARKSEKIRLQLLGFLLKYRSWLQSPRYLPFIGALVEHPKSKTFGFQKVLPPLPVPTLEETCEKYLQTVRTLLTDEEFLRTKVAVTEFQRPGGVGEQLQEALLERAQRSRNWLAEWWLDYAYLLRREPLICVNWYAADSLDPPRKNQIERTASFISSALKFKKMINTETLGVDRMFGTVPLCMDQFSKLFSTCRIPGIPKDALVTCGPDESKHVVVIRKNQFYWFDVYHEDGTALSATDLKRQLGEVLELSDHATDLYPPLGVLTTENRDTWAEIRRKLIDTDGVNRDSLAIIEKALFVVCLDEGNPKNLDEHAGVMQHGDGRNRWFDKSFQVIVQKDGQIGPNAEHSRGESPSVIPLFDFAAARERTGDEPSEPSGRVLPPVNRMQWKLTPEIEQAIETACQNFDRIAADFDLKVLPFDSYGKGFTKTCRLPPDAFIQMALQLAYFKMHGRPTLTYETAQTRVFFHGSTEAIRSCSGESMEFVTAMEQAVFSPQTKFDFIRKAVETHAQQTRQAMAGKGVDRHLLGLRILASENEGELPDIFRDKAYQLGWQLSTSQTPMRNIGVVVGFAPVAEDGYGVSYLVKEDSLYFNIVSWKSCPDTDSTRFAECLEEALLEMHNIATLGLSERS
jgi:carnitine O-acetyltransferase